MGWFSNLFGNPEAREAKRIEQMVARLAGDMASNDEATFIAALSAAVRYGPLGSDHGVRAMEEAMRRRANDHGIGFAEPTLGGLTARDGESIAEAPSKLVELARERALLRDPRVAQDLMSACLSYHGEGGVRNTLMQALEAGGPDQFFNFQLLYNHQQQAVKLAHARGGRTWTERVSGTDD